MHNFKRDRAASRAPHWRFAVAEGRARGEKNRHLLDGPAGVCYCFSEFSGKAGSRFSSGAGRRAFGGGAKPKCG
jgi:hypothetical protein